MSRNTKVLPNKYYWIGITALTVWAVVSTVLIENAFVLFVFPVLLYLLGRGKQVREEGLVTH